MPAFSPPSGPPPETFSSFEVTESPDSITQLVHSFINDRYLDSDDIRLTGFTATLRRSYRGLVIDIRASALERENGALIIRESDLHFGTLSLVDRGGEVWKVIPILDGDSDSEHRPIASVVRMLRDRFAPVTTSESTIKTPNDPQSDVSPSANAVSQSDSTVEADSVDAIAHFQDEPMFDFVDFADHVVTPGHRDVRDVLWAGCLANGSWSIGGDDWTVSQLEIIDAPQTRSHFWIVARIHAAEDVCDPQIRPFLLGDVRSVLTASHIIRLDDGDFVVPPGGWVILGFVNVRPNGEVRLSSRRVLVDHMGGSAEPFSAVRDLFYELTDRLRAMGPTEKGGDAEPQAMRPALRSSPAKGAAHPAEIATTDSSRREVEIAPPTPNTTPDDVPESVSLPSSSASRRPPTKLTVYIRQRATWLYIKPFVAKDDLPALLTKIKNHRGELACSLKTLGKIRALGQRGLLDLDPRDFPT